MYGLPLWMFFPLSLVLLILAFATLGAVVGFMLGTIHRRRNRKSILNKWSGLIAGFLSFALISYIGIALLNFLIDL